MPAILIARSGSDDNAPLSHLVHIRDIQAVTTSPSRVADAVSSIAASDVITSLRASDPTPSAVLPSTAAAHTLGSQSPARLASVHYTSSSSHSSSNTSPNNKGLETGLIIVAVAFIVLGAAYRIYRYIQKRRNRQQRASLPPPVSRAASCAYPYPQQCARTAARRLRGTVACTLLPSWRPRTPRAIRSRTSRRTSRLFRQSCS
jgi:hypothetical protein